MHVHKLQTHTHTVCEMSDGILVVKCSMHIAHIDIYQKANPKLKFTVFSESHLLILMFCFYHSSVLNPHKSATLDK